MTVRKSKSYLVISSIHLGASQDILNVYRQVAKYYKAEVIHLGPTASNKDQKRNVRLKKEIEDIDEKIDYLEGSNLVRAEMAKANREFELESIKEREEDCVLRLTTIFDKVNFVTTEALSISMNFKKDYASGASQTFNGRELSKFLFLSPIPPAGDRNTKSPITSISVDFLKSLGRSWIVPHPVPIAECYPRPGLNEAYTYYTTGGLKHPERPTCTTDQYKFAHMPCAVLVLVDELNGEFHPKQVHIEYLKGKNSPNHKKSKIVVLDDGLCFNEDGYKELSSDDKATASTDEHVPYTHPGQTGAVREINRLHKPATFIAAGDLADFDPISHHNEHKPGERENKRLIDTLNGMYRLMFAMTNFPSIKNRVLIDSNHHEWVTDLVMKNPYLIGMLDWETLAKGKDLANWKVMIRTPGETEIYKFGDITIRHGDKDGGVRGGEKKTPNGKYLCGHFHRYAAYRRAVMLGCGAALGPKFIGGSITAWQNQVATLTKCNEVAAVNAKVVLHENARKVSRVAYRNQILEFDWYQVFERKLA